MDKCKELQKKIKFIINELGLTQIEMARRVYCERFEDDDPEEIRKFTETFRQNLKRKAKPELLESYLANIANLREFKNSDLAFSNPLDLGFIPLDVKRALQEVSKELVNNIDSEGSKL
ncbi:hypothetical protein H5162_00090 [Pseudoalteromonas sp. SR41-8]|uniref:hypothetical protein n=1 Tax=Pseudoalteromonas sp. SR41-8 TaxID=2760946 RepID=UPI0016033B2D|nr:hypothetical protein [Pseudoalteromonas sp. SR41-8]MBB1307844.1 hypothetical protein [Pseudoalteromonas sp. SR41-8]